MTERRGLSKKQLLVLVVVGAFVGVLLGLAVLGRHRGDGDPGTRTGDGSPPSETTGPPARVSGRVLLEPELTEDADESERARNLVPPAKGTCRAMAWQSGVQLTGPVECDEDGAFVLDVPLQASATVTVEMLVPGRLRAVLSTALEPGGRAQLATVALGLGQTIVGNVVDVQGQPVADASIQARPDPDLGEPEPWRAVSDASGRFLIDTLPPGPVVLRAWKRGWATTVAQAIVPSDGVLLVLDRLLALEGRIVAAPELMDRARVRLEGSGLWPAVEVEPNADGTFRFSEVPDGLYALEAVVTDEAGGPEYASFPLENVDPEMYVSLALVEAFRIPVRVVDTGGRPVPSARVTLGYGAIGLLQRVAVTDLSGRVRAGPVVPGPYVLHADADGYLPSAAKEVEVTSRGGVEEQVLVVGRPASIAGIVVDEDGRAVAGAVVFVDGDGVFLPGTDQSRADVFEVALRAIGTLGVTLRVPDIPLFGGDEMFGGSVRSDADGRFVVSGLVPGNYDVWAAHGSFATSGRVRLRLRAGEARGGIRLVLRHGQLLTGRVLGGNRRPLTGARLEFADGSIATTDARGVFDGGLWAGAVEVVVRAPGMVPRRVELDVGDRPLDVELELEEANGVLKGRVLGGNERPVGDARVTLRMVDGLSSTELVWTDERGSFTFDRLPTGAAELEVDHRDYVLHTSRARVQDRGAPGIEIRLREGWSVEVMVRASGSGRPIEGALVRTGDVVVTTDDGGRARFSRLPGTSASFDVVAEGRTPRRGSVQRTGARNEVVVELDEGGGIEGRVADWRGDPVPDVVVEIRDPQGRTLASVRADDRGRFVARGLPEGRIVLEARPPDARADDLVPARLESDVLAGRVTREVDLRFDRG